MGSAMREPIAEGSRAPEFRLSSTEGNVTLTGLLADGRRLVLAFYYEDATPSCESELAVLRDAHDVTAEHGARVLAVSADRIESHRAFAERLGGLPFPLASDERLEAAAAYGVVDEGDTRRSRRAVFVIDAGGVVARAIVPFQPASLAHVEALLAALGVEV